MVNQASRKTAITFHSPKIKMRIIITKSITTLSEKATVWKISSSVQTSSSNNNKSAILSIFHSQR